MLQNVVRCTSELLGMAAICTDRYDQADISGFLYHISLEKPISFSGIIDLMGHMENIFDNCAYPQAYFSTRSFGDDSQSGKAASFPAKEVSQQMDEDVLKNARGEKATFVVQVQFRQNATWQGTISWTEEKKTRRFRSALEMIKLMDDALSTGTEQPDDGWHD